MTLGEDRVRVKFNPSVDGLVDKLKQKTAELIDICEEYKRREYGTTSTNSEVNRALSLAQTYYETAVMYAVKAATADK